MIKVINEVKVYNDHDDHDAKEEKLHITNHASDDTMIVIVFDGVSFKVNAKDLEAAVSNAVNCARH